MATSGRGSGVVGYNVQAAVETEHHLIVAREVITVGNDRAQLDVYVCPAGNRLTYRFTREEGGRMLRRYWTDLCGRCSLKPQCTLATERRISRWEHEEVLEAVQRGLDENPLAMRRRRETVEHPFGTIKARFFATLFLMKRLKNVRTEMAFSVLAYNLTRVMNILGIRQLIAAIGA